VLDHVQYSQRGWQNRNWVAGHAGGRVRLTVPVRTAGRLSQSIAETRTAGRRWAAAHWRTISQVYGRAPHFDALAPRLRAIYADPSPVLADVCLDLLQALLAVGGQSVALVRTSELNVPGQRTEMLIHLCRMREATVLRVGTGALTYLDYQALQAAGIELEVASYTWPPYRQGPGPFQSGLSLLDTVMHLGPDTPALLAHGLRIIPWSPTA
jgi:hypothetical protein